ncbi:hypothetical protein B5C00_10395 [Staphylococcus delphini]|nr:hypothetical protein B5C00_10395 [Staphylococcus delphini]
MQATNHATLLRDQLARKIQFGINQVFISIKPNLVVGPAPRKGSHGGRSQRFKTTSVSPNAQTPQMLKPLKCLNSSNAQTHPMLKPITP